MGKPSLQCGDRATAREKQATAAPPRLMRADVVVVGGGILGAATLWELAARGVDAALFERASFAQESTGKSAAIVRMHYSNAPVVRMAVRSRDALMNLPETLGCDSVYTRSGWLFLLDESERQHAITNRQMQLGEGAISREVPLDELSDLIPGIEIGGLGHALFEADSGFADPVATTIAYLRAAQGLGAALNENVGVDRILVKNGAVTGVETGGRRILCGSVVLAAGAWSVQLADNIGLRLPVEITREQDVIYETSSANVAVAVSDQADRIYFRPLSSTELLVGRGYPKPYEVVDPNGYDTTIDEGFEADVRARLIRRIPSLSPVRTLGSRVGLYSVTPDWHPLLGPVESVRGLYLATGGSGHSFKLGPAIGEMLASCVLGLPIGYADIRLFALERFERGMSLTSTYGGNRA